MLAGAARQGFEHGLAAAMEQMEADAGDDGGELTVPGRRGTQVDLSTGSMTADGLHLSDKDIERLGRPR
jgi:hypothetical protein